MLIRRSRCSGTKKRVRSIEFFFLGSKVSSISFLSCNLRFSQQISLYNLIRSLIQKRILSRYIMTSISDILVLITLFSAGVPPVGSIVINVSSEAPVVTMRILNEEHMDAVVTQLGQKLTLRIEIQPVDGESLTCLLIFMQDTSNFSLFLSFINSP